MGLRPWRERYRQAMVALRGEPDVPPSRFGPSSLLMLRPRVAVPLWRGRPYLPRQVLLTNLFNHQQTPIELGWSVMRTQVLDFRGRALTYDSHNGTDLSIPVGTTVLTAAAGEIVRVASEFNRGGLKVFVDHGGGLMTCYAHLARSLVAEGDVLGRGDPIAISGYSGLDALVTFPFGVPHVHFNTWLDGEPVDPFARPGECSLWRAGASPRPPDEAPEHFVPSEYDAGRLEQAIAACKTPEVRARLRGINPIGRRAAHTIVEMNYYPTRFERRVCPYAARHERTPRLDLPFAAADFDGVTFADDL
jgi:murein DD-endopeptidase